ncbi:hypothetical protein KPH14_009277 [Odynerus spinipes]|uniref:Uncharacterized protein n=1 Tax=Odynerus spinipes TaxID=1348599 RepID=A0AAD9RP07_9HYME|nr:hypothetical protein KPH14_009277 [Odynerus spinipes]
MVTATKALALALPAVEKRSGDQGNSFLARETQRNSKTDLSLRPAAGSLDANFATPVRTECQTLAWQVSWESESFTPCLEARPLFSTYDDCARENPTLSTPTFLHPPTSLTSS